MFMNKPVYMRISRERTRESIVVALETGLATIKKYDEKQQFMNMLGQENFWKKNRLDLWAALKQEDVAQPDPDHIMLNSIAFQNTPVMLSTIKERLKHETEILIQEQRKIKTTSCGYDDWCNIYERGERQFVTRAVRIDVPNHYIRTEDLPAFDQELAKLLAKYVVKDPLRLRNGRKRFNFRTVANRYVERVFGFKPEQNYYW